MKYETYIILIPVSKVIDGRKLVERLENQQFKDKTEVENAFCFDEHDPLAIEDLRIIRMGEFMDWMNDQDDDTPKSEKFKLKKFWMGYVQIKK